MGRSTSISMMTIKSAIEATERIRNIGKNGNRLVSYMNPIWQFSSTESYNDKCCAPSGAVNILGYLTSFNYIVVSHAIGNLGLIHIHIIAVGGNSPTRVHRHWNESLDLDVMDEPELQQLFYLIYVKGLN